MPDMPQTAAKGSILERVDKALNNPGFRGEILNALQAGTPLTGIMSPQEPIGLSGPEQTHLDTDWFGERWWPGAQAGAHAVEQILRAGFIDAINKANELGVPIDTYWICHPGHGQSHADVQLPADQHVEVTVLWSAQQVTVIIHTPDPGIPPNIDPAEPTIDEPIMVWFWKDGQVRHVQPKHRP